MKLAFVTENIGFFFALYGFSYIGWMHFHSPVSEGSVK